MIQTASTTTHPGPSFFRPKSSRSRTTSANDSHSSVNTVYGASYSYTDMLAHAAAASSSRPNTPPISLPPLREPTHRAPSTSPTRALSSLSLSSLSHSLPNSSAGWVKTRGRTKGYKDFVKMTDDDWAVDDDDDPVARRLRQVKSIEHRPPSSSTARKITYPLLYPPAEASNTEKKRSVSATSAATRPSVDRHPSDPTPEILTLNTEISRVQKFEALLASPTVSLPTLRALAWSGIPIPVRPQVWKLLLGYVPPTRSRREEVEARKRREYIEAGEAVWGSAGARDGSRDGGCLHQIRIDVPRTCPGVPLWGQETTQRSLERILYLWAVRHPASGYVQGINDLVTPFFHVFLGEYTDADPSTFDLSKLTQQQLFGLEADTFWCLSTLLSGIQDNYIHSQPGILRQLRSMKDLVSRIDAPLATHIDSLGIEFVQFAFRWMNCLLMRELPPLCIIRMWDTYISEGASTGFREFHVYVCAAFLVKWSKELKEMEFGDAMVFLQRLPTGEWGDKEVELVLSEAYMWQSLFKDAVAHLR
ncbi:GTPase-activating protein [Saitoella coloradoensis]